MTSTPTLAGLGVPSIVFDTDKFKATVTGAVEDVTVNFTIDGASSVDIEVVDPARTLLKSGILSSKVRMQLQQWSMELVQVKKQADQLVATFEDLAIARLRQHNSPVSIAAGAMTRVGFIKKLITDDEPWIRVFAPVEGALTQEALSRGSISQAASAAASGVASGGSTSTSAQPVVEAILTAVTDPNVQIAMLVGSYLEGGWAPPFSVGDFGTSFGPYQIHLPAHPGVTQQQAEDPAWATQFMLSSYEAGVAAQPASLWKTDPMTAAEQAAVAAERPAVSYFQSQGAEKVQAAFTAGYEATVNALQTQGVQSGAAAGNAPADQAELAVKFALAQVGKPYIWGGVGPSGFDCSGLCYAAYQSASVAIPRTSQAQWAGLPHVGLDQLLPGDLIFYAGSDGTPTAPGHVVMCIGNGQMVQAEETGTNIFTGIIPTGAIGAARPVAAITGGKAGGTTSGGTAGAAGLEDTWTCITRLAGEVQWRCFVPTPGVVWFVPDSYLITQRVLATIQEGKNGIDNIDFDFDEGKIAATLTITCHADQWQVQLGGILKVVGCGPADSGVWIVSQIERSLLSSVTTITCVQPEPSLPEPIQTATASGATVNLLGSNDVPPLSPTSQHLGADIAANLARKTALIKDKEFSS